MRRLAKRIVPARWRWWLRRQHLHLRGWWYRGDAVVCPCCGGRFRKFLPMTEGDHPRPDAICPACTAMERHRLLMLFIEHATDLPHRPQRVLYLAPEPGIQARLQRWPHLDYLSADLESPVAMQHFDLQAIPHPDASFDAIFCAHVLAHVRDDRRALAELRRVLAPQGVLYLMDRPDASLPHTLEAEGELTPRARAMRFGQADRWRRYGRDFTDRLRRAGFRVEEVAFAERLTPEERKRYGLRTDELIYVCRKAKSGEQA